VDPCGPLRGGQWPPAARLAGIGEPPLPAIPTV